MTGYMLNVNYTFSGTTSGSWFGWDSVEQTGNVGGQPYNGLVLTTYDYTTFVSSRSPYSYRFPNAFDFTGTQNVTLWNTSTAVFGHMSEDHTTYPLEGYNLYLTSAYIAADGYGSPFTIHYL